MTRARATAEGYIWNHAGKVLEYVLLFCITVLIARGLGVEGNGVYAMLVTFSQLLVVFSSLSFESALNRFIPQLEVTANLAVQARLRYMIRRLFLVRMLLLAITIGIAFLILRLPGLAVPETVGRYFWILAGYAAVRSFVQLVSMVFVAQLRTAPLARIAVSVRIVEIAGIAFMLGSGLSVWDVMTFLVSTGMLQAGACIYFARQDFTGEVEPFPLRPLYAFGAVYWTNTIVEFFLGRQGDLFFLTTLLPTHVPASMYAVAFTLVLASTQVLTLGLGGVSLASFSRLAATSPEKMDRFFGFLVRVVSLLVLPVLAFVFFNAGPIVTLLFSQTYAGAAILVQGMVAFRVIARLFAGSENAEYLLAKGRTLSTVQIGVIGAIVNVMLDILLIPKYLAFGAVFGSGCANLVVNILGSLYVRKSAGHPVIQWAFWGLVVLTSVIAGVATTILLPGDGWTMILGRAIAFCALTALLLFLSRPFPAIDIEWVKEINENIGSWFKHFTRQGAGTMMQMS